MKRLQLHFEQAVYGSFPFWDRGYAVLAHSPGCRPEWLTELQLVCQRYGEPPSGAPVPPALFSLRLPSGPWAVVGVGSPGADDQGRPGALAFHALFVTTAEFRKAGYNPFALAAAHRRDWGPATSTLSAGLAAVEEPLPTPRGQDSKPDFQRAWIQTALNTHKRVAIESAQPISELAARVWAGLPSRVRRRASVATLAFGNANRFDLVALPRLAGIALDSSYVFLDPAIVDEPIEPPAARRTLGHRASLRGRRYVLLLAAAFFGAFLIALVMRRQKEAQSGDSPGSNRQSSASRRADYADRAFSTVAPSRAIYPEERADTEERHRVTEALGNLAEQFGVLPARAFTDGAAEDRNATRLMDRLAENLRYQGPLLSASELAEIASGPARERERVLGWHVQVSRFVADRPLPPDFAQGPLRWQLDTLCWSFHIEPDPKLGAAEVPLALGEALARTGSLAKSPSMHRYPALDSYVHFLSRLPRR